MDAGWPNVLSAETHNAAVIVMMVFIVLLIGNRNDFVEESECVKIGHHAQVAMSPLWYACILFPWPSSRVRIKQWHWVVAPFSIQNGLVACRRRQCWNGFSEQLIALEWIGSDEIPILSLESFTRSSRY
jgi:hypothetical protein